MCALDDDPLKGVRIITVGLTNSNGDKPGNEGRGIGFSFG